MGPCGGCPTKTHPKWCGGHHPDTPPGTHAPRAATRVVVRAQPQVIRLCRLSSRRGASVVSPRGVHAPAPASEGGVPARAQRACRRHGIQRWPRRQLLKLSKAIDQINATGSVKGGDSGSSNPGVRCKGPPALAGYAPGASSACQSRAQLRRTCAVTGVLLPGWIGLCWCSRCCAQLFGGRVAHLHALGFASVHGLRAVQCCAEQRGRDRGRRREAAATEGGAASRPGLPGLAQARSRSPAPTRAGPRSRSSSRASRCSRTPGSVPSRPPPTAPRRTRCASSGCRGGARLPGALSRPLEAPCARLSGGGQPVPCAHCASLSVPRQAGGGGGGSRMWLDMGAGPGT